MNEDFQPDPHIPLGVTQQNIWDMVAQWSFLVGREEAGNTGHMHELGDRGSRILFLMLQEAEGTFAATQCLST